MADLFRFVRSETPVLVSVPHAGTYIPEDIRQIMTPEAQAVEDTDWFVDQLYDFAPSLGIGLITATHSRYVVDLNRHPEGETLYPNADSTGTVPTSTFKHEPIYLPHKEPDADQIARRVEVYYRPYHVALAAELKRLRERFGIAILWDGHSIKSAVPRFFQGTLPELNFGTYAGRSAAASFSDAIAGAAKPFSQYRQWWNGRFVGGYITRTFGKPENNIHAIQLEMTWATYMSETRPYALDAKSVSLRACLKACLAAAITWSEQAASTSARR